jgi:hypothetical protein
MWEWDHSQAAFSKLLMVDMTIIYKMHKNENKNRDGVEVW